MKPATGAELKSTGQQMALFNAGKPWTDDMIAKLRIFCKVRKDIGRPIFRAEEFRAVAESSGWPLPPSSKVWGALPKIAMKRGIIRPTGQYEPAQSPKTHGHPVRTYWAC
jgi:hypothetical protein